MTLPSACPTLCSFTKFVVDKRGHVRGRFGPKTPAASLAPLLKELLEEPGPEEQVDPARGAVPTP